MSAGESLPGAGVAAGSWRWGRFRHRGIGRPRFRGARAGVRRCKDDPGVLETGDRDEPGSRPGGVGNLTTACDR